MAAAVLAMLGIGVAMVASLGDYQELVSTHRPLGILVLILVVIRYVKRRLHTLPAFPPTISPRERVVATASEISKHRCNGLHNGPVDRCRYIRTRPDKVEVFQFTLTSSHRPIFILFCSG